MTPQTICFVVTVPFVINFFLAEIIKKLAASGWKVTVVVNTNEGAVAPEVAACAEIISLNIHRKPAPFADIMALATLTRFFWTRSFAVVQCITPKAGLLAMIAARFASVPVRAHIFCGQVWATRDGLWRYVLKKLDQLLAYCATDIRTDSASQREFLIQEGVVPAYRIQTRGDGSLCGANTKRFIPDAAARRAVRSELGIAEDDTVFLYVGRFNREKGLLELASAFQQLSIDTPNTHLLLVGPDEADLAPELKALAGLAVTHLHFIGMTRVPERYMAAADVLCLPSYREGFPQVLIEAASAGLPTIATRIYGIVDAVIDGETGLLVPVRDVHSLAAAMRRLANDASLREQLGTTGRTRAVRLFSAEHCAEEWLQYYTQKAA